MFKIFTKKRGLDFFNKKWVGKIGGCSKKGVSLVFTLNLSNVVFVSVLICVSLPHLHDFYQYSLYFTKGEDSLIIESNHQICGFCM